MRWAALGVDYEMAGKDLIDSVRLSGRICRILGRQQPEGFNYELFLDENGEKISKSRGNGLTIEEWLTYASPESLSLYMYQSPRKAKRLYFDVIPRAVDEYVGHLAAYPKEEQAAKLMNPVWHIHEGAPPEAELPISFALLLNLASASNSEDRDVLWGFIQRYAPDATPEAHPLLDELVGYAIRYFHDFVKPSKRYRAPTDKERAALADLDTRLAALPDKVLAEEIQNEVYAVGKAHDFEPLRDWFQALYEVLLGQTQGPRFGSFVELYGVAETRALIAKALSGRIGAASAGRIGSAPDAEPSFAGGVRRLGELRPSRRPWLRPALAHHPQREVVAAHLQRAVSDFVASPGGTLHSTARPRINRISATRAHARTPKPWPLASLHSSGRPLTSIPSSVMVLPRVSSVPPSRTTSPIEADRLSTFSSAWRPWAGLASATAAILSSRLVRACLFGERLSRGLGFLWRRVVRQRRGEAAVLRARWAARRFSRPRRCRRRMATRTRSARGRQTR